MDATIIIAIVPVVLLVAYIVWLVRAKITEGRDIDLREPITGVVICLVAVLIIGSMTASTVTYTYSEETNTLYINQNLIDSRQPFDSYGDEVKSVVIGNNCRLIEAGTLDSLTNLEYVSIGEGIDVRTGAFGVSFEDAFGETVTDLAGRYFVGTGDGTLYLCDPSIYAYNDSTITGLASGVTGVVNLVLPESGATSVGANAFKANETIEKVLMTPHSSIVNIGYHVFDGCTALEVAKITSLTDSGVAVFYGCTALESIELPPTLTAIKDAMFDGCSSLVSVEYSPELISIGYRGFAVCNALESIELPPTLETLGNGSFNSCTSLTELAFPASLTSISGYALTGCTGITQVSFAAGFAPELAANWQGQLKFYASDGTTQLDASDPANFAGKTFQGTANALVELAPGQLTLTPLQFQQVQLHTQELQDQELDIQPLPFQPTVQTQDQEPVAA